MEVAEAVQLYLEPEVDKILVLSLRMLADQLVGCFESRHGRLVMVVCGLYSAKERLQTGRLRTIARTDEAQPLL